MSNESLIVDTFQGQLQSRVSLLKIKPVTFVDFFDNHDAALRNTSLKKKQLRSLKRFCNCSSLSNLSYVTELCGS